MTEASGLRFQYSDRLWRILVCPSCRTPLSREEGAGARCHGCGTAYGHADTGALDLRLKTAKKYELEHELGSPLLSESGVDFRPLPVNSAPEVDYSSVAVPPHMTKELLSYFPRAKGPHSMMLDLGCGRTRHRGVCEHAGFEYVGLDYDSPAAPILGDGHSLPFKDASFGFVLSVAVLEHIRFPSVMTREVLRVLQAGGVYIGTVSFLEPFHGQSFYHHTHLGVYNTLRDAGFAVERIGPNPKWPVLTAQAMMSLFPKMPFVLCRALVAPLQWLHVLWWKLGSVVDDRASRNARLTRTAGAFFFVAAKTDSR